MKFHVLTLFPQMVDSLFADSILGRAQKEKLIEINTINIRDYTDDKHRNVDDYTYGGGAGMLMQAQPIYDAWKSVTSGRRVRTVYVTPQGSVFNNHMAKALAEEEELVLLCGHYEGIDERVLEEVVTDYISIGDYVLTGGELAVGVIVDAISRFVPGVLGNDESATTESFYNDLLEYPQYSRPEVWHDKEVPKVLLSGDRKKIMGYRLNQSIERTKERRPDLYKKYLHRIETADALERDKKDKRNYIHVTRSLRDGTARILLDTPEVLVTYLSDCGICNIVFREDDAPVFSGLVIPKKVVKGFTRVYSNKPLSLEFLKNFGFNENCNGNCSETVLRQYVYTAKVSLSNTKGVSISDKDSEAEDSLLMSYDGNGAMMITYGSETIDEELIGAEIALINEDLERGYTPYLQVPVDSRLNSLQETVGTYEATRNVYLYCK